MGLRCGVGDGEVVDWGWRLFAMLYLRWLAVLCMSRVCIGISR